MSSVDPSTMKFALQKTTKIYKHDGLKPTGTWVTEVTTEVVRSGDEVSVDFHDMKVGDSRQLLTGYEIVRVI